MPDPTPEQVQQAITILDRGLSYHMNRMARAQGEDALWMLKNGRYDAATEAICNAVASCDDHLAGQYLREVRSILAPDRFASA